MNKNKVFIFSIIASVLCILGCISFVFINKRTSKIENEIQYSQIENNKGFDLEIKEISSEVQNEIAEKQDVELKEPVVEIMEQDVEKIIEEIKEQPTEKAPTEDVTQSQSGMQPKTEQVNTSNKQTNTTQNTNKNIAQTKTEINKTPVENKVIDNTTQQKISTENKSNNNSQTVKTNISTTKTNQNTTSSKANTNKSVSNTTNQEKNVQTQVKQEEKPVTQEVIAQPVIETRKNDEYIQKIKNYISTHETDRMKKYGYSFVVDKNVVKYTNPFTYSDFNMQTCLNRTGEIMIYAHDYYYNGKYVETQCFVY